MRCKPEEKAHMIALVDEMKEYQQIIQSKKLNNLTVGQKITMTKRMAEIVKEMKEFRRMYPDD